MLQHDILNKQYLTLGDALEYEKIVTYTDLFLAEQRHTDGFVGFPVLYSVSIAAIAQHLMIAIDLPINKFHSPPMKEAYVAFLYVEDGTKRKGHRPSEPAGPGRGLTVLEGLAMVAAWPEVLQDHAIDLINSRYSIECVPTLYQWDNKIHMSAVCPDVQDSMCGAPIVRHELSFTRDEWTALTGPQFKKRLRELTSL